MSLRAQGGRLSVVGGAIVGLDERLLIAGNSQGYTDAPYFAFTSMWGYSIPQNDQLDATSSMRIDEAAFPAGMTFYWDVTPDPDWTSVNGFLHLGYGNYDNSPASITPRQVYTITDLSLAVTWTFDGDPATGLLSECWLSSAAAASGAFTKTHEVAFFPKQSANTIAYLNSLPAVGPGTFVDSNAVTWSVKEGLSGEGLPYFIAYRAAFADHQGALPFDDLLTFLTNQGKITGNEWFNGLAFGPEPHSGVGSLTVDTFSPSYAGAARVPWTITNLSAAPQSSTSVQLTWRAAPGATSHEYRVNGGAWTATSGPASQLVTGLAASTAYTFEVRGVNATGNGAQSNTAGATTAAPAAANVITNGGFVDETGWAGFWYSGKSATGKAYFTDSPAFDGVEQGVTLVAGKYYELTWTIGDYASGNVYPFLAGGTQRVGTVRAANGTYTERLLVNTGNTVFGFQMETGGTLSVDNVSLVGPYNTATVGGA